VLLVDIAAERKLPDWWFARAQPRLAGCLRMVVGWVFRYFVRPYGDDPDAESKRRQKSYGSWRPPRLAASFICLVPATGPISAGTGGPYLPPMSQVDSADLDRTTAKPDVRTGLLQPVVIG